jgi:GNAT superfamily N-acetyltransferase
MRKNNTSIPIPNLHQGEESDLRIEVEMQPENRHQQVIWNGLRAYNEEHVSSEGDLFFAVFLRRDDGEILGGILAKEGRGWLHIITLWIDVSMRGKEYGSHLVETAEKVALERGCHNAYLDTFSFQAKPFYERCGYAVFGVLDDFPEGHQRYFMRKSL